MINGILNIYKERGYTSHDVVARLRGITGQKKIGHTGTLDPDAEGVLPVCLGRATKVCGILTDRDKSYETVLLLGKTTDTQDISGKVLGESPVSVITEKEAAACIRSFIGDIDQVPPMYSALKVGGRRLYELAREGKTVERRGRRITVFDIRILDISLPHIRMEVKCSKGTYIRTLCHDIGCKLGCGGCMEHLLRTRVGKFDIRDSVKLDEVEKAVAENRLDGILLPLDSVFADLQKISVKDRYASLGYNGNPLLAEQIIRADMDGSYETDGRYRLYDEADRFIGIYCYDKKTGKLRPEKMFFDSDQISERT